jgi:hypothetical protein
MESVVASFEDAAVALAGREFPQVLLLHANELNADLMPELLAMFRRRGYTSPEPDPPNWVTEAWSQR